MNPLTPSDHFSLGLDFKEAGRLLEALHHLRHARDQGFFQPELLLVIGQVECALGRYEDALSTLRAASRSQPDSPEPPLWQGRAAMESGRHTPALYHTNVALERHPHYGPALVQKGIVLFGLRRYQDAYEVLDEAMPVLVGAAPSVRARVDLWRARVLDALGRADEAADVLNGVLRSVDDCADAFLLAGQIAQRFGELEQAEVLLARAYELEPRSPSVVTALSALHAERRHPHEALKFLTVAFQVVKEEESRRALHRIKAQVFEQLGQPTRALREYHLATEGSPTHADLHLERARLHLVLERYGDALRSVEQYRAIRGEDEAWRASYAEVLNEYALALGHQGDIPGALHWYQRLIDLDPDSLDFPGRAARGTLDDAWTEPWLSGLSRVLDEDPQHETALLCLGLLHMQRGEFVPARRRFKRYRKVAAEPSLGYFWLGRIHHRRGSFRRARFYYEQAASRRPGVREFAWEYARALRAGGAEPSLRRQALRRVLALDADHQEAREQLALICEEQGDAWWARHHWQRCVARDDAVPHFHEALARCAGALGLWDLALESADRALALLPGKPEFHLTRAEVLRALHRHAEALQALQEARRHIFDRHGETGNRFLRQLIELHLAQCRPEDAEGLILARQRRDEAPIWHVLAAECAGQFGAHAIAQGEAERALSKPGLTAPERVRARVSLARALAAKGDWGQAGRALCEALVEDARGEQRVTCWRWIERCAQRQGDARAAEEAGRQGQRWDRERQAQEFLARDECADAHALASALAREAPGDARFLALHAATTLALGDLEKARALARSLVERAPEVARECRAYYHFRALRHDDVWRAAPSAQTAPGEAPTPL